MKPCVGRLQFFWLSLLLVSLTSCARLPTAPRAVHPQVSSAADLLQKLQDQAAACNSLKARGTVAVMSPQKNYSGSALLTAAKPARLRVDILNFWGQSLHSFLTAGQEMKLLVYGDSKLYRGPATPSNLRRFLPVVISQEDFVAALSGHIAYQNYDNPILQQNSEPTVHRLELTNRAGQEKVILTIDAPTLYVISAQWFSNAGEEMLRAEFGNFLSSGGFSGPSDILLASGDRENSVRLRYRDLTYNAPLSPEAWELPVSDTVRQVSFGP